MSHIVFIVQLFDIIRIYAITGGNRPLSAVLAFLGVGWLTLAVVRTLILLISSSLAQVIPLYFRSILGEVVLSSRSQTENI